MSLLVSIAITALLLLLGYFSLRLLGSSIERLGQRNGVSPYRIKYVSKTLSLVLGVFYVILLLSWMGIGYSQVTIFLSSVFAVLGIALFAQWSILSNITAGLLIFFGFPYRVGDRIKVLDLSDEVTGVVEEITLFHVLIRQGEELITFPNSVILQKPVVKLSHKAVESSENLAVAAERDKD